MITANDFRARLAPATLTTAEVEALIAATTDKALHERQPRFTVTIPRHSMDLAKKIAVAAGWSVEVMTVRSSEPDAPDGLRCSLP
jgi:hypothetical protein